MTCEKFEDGHKWKAFYTSETTKCDLCACGCARKERISDGYTWIEGENEGEEE